MESPGKCGNTSINFLVFLVSIWNIIKEQGYGIRSSHLSNMYNDKIGWIEVVTAHHTLLSNMYNDKRGRLCTHHTLLSMTCNKITEVGSLLTTHCSITYIMYIVSPRAVLFFTERHHTNGHQGGGGGGNPDCQSCGCPGCPPGGR